VRRTRGGTTPTRRRRTQAARADKYALYQQAVQDPEGDVARLGRMYERHFGRRPHLLREDFCGTAALACAWVAAHGEHRAVGVDLDPEPLAWGRRHNLARLTPHQAKRIRLLRGNVLGVRSARADLVVAFNFSYFLWKERAQLVRYFRRARASLASEGLLVLDAYGGPEAQERRTETRDCDGFDYVWDQAHFDPITHETTCFIHFEFSDGSRKQRAFRYDWRVWTLPELQELLREAGFDATEVCWEGTEQRTNEPNGVFRPRAHIVARKGSRRRRRA
jgi:hypothetical protein